MTKVRFSVLRTISVSSSQRFIEILFRSRHFSIPFTDSSTPIDKRPAEIAGAPPKSLISFLALMRFIQAGHMLCNS